MDSSAPNPLIAGRRARGLSIVLVCLIVLIASIAPATAGRMVRLYDVDVGGANSADAIQEAMRQTLIRATGRREAANDPALGGIIVNASRYVQSSRAVSGGTTRIVFDGAAIEREIVAAGRSVWDRNRPFTIVVLSPAPTGGAADSARRALEQVAESRGLPISLVPMAVIDATGNDLGRDVLVQAAQRLGGDAVLVGRGESAALNGEWQWTLHTGFASESWTGPFEAGIHGAVDVLARSEDETLLLGEAAALVQVSGVRTLSDYAFLSRLLDAAPGVRHVALEEADGTTATFRVIVRGGADALDGVLGGSTRLVRSGTANARMLYQLRP